MPKFFGGIFDRKTPAKQIAFVPYTPPPLTDEELTMATLIFCVTAHRSIPRNIQDKLDALVPENTALSPLYKEILVLWQNANYSPDEEIEILFAIMLDIALKKSRQNNKDYVWPDKTAGQTVPVEPPAKDIYDEIQF